LNRNYKEISPCPSFPKRGNKRELFQRGDKREFFQRGGAPFPLEKGGQVRQELSKKGGEREDFSPQ